MDFVTFTKILPWRCMAVRVDFTYLNCFSLFFFYFDSNTTAKAEKKKKKLKKFDTLAKERVKLSVFESPLDIDWLKLLRSD